MSEFQSALVKVAAVLAVKNTVVALLSVRSRLIKDDFASGRPSDKVMEEDGKTPEFVSKMCVEQQLDGLDMRAGQLLIRIQGCIGTCMLDNLGRLGFLFKFQQGQRFLAYSVPAYSPCLINAPHYCRL